MVVPCWVFALCAQCNATMTNPDYRYILTITAMDHTGVEYLTLFNDTAKELLTHSANEMNKIKDEDAGLWKAIVQRATFRTFLFRVRVKVSRAPCRVPSSPAWSARASFREWCLAVSVGRWRRFETSRGKRRR